MPQQMPVQGLQYPIYPPFAAFWDASSLPPELLPPPDRALRPLVPDNYYPHPLPLPTPKSAADWAKAVRDGGFEGVADEPPDGNWTVPLSEYKVAPAQWLAAGK